MGLALYRKYRSKSLDEIVGQSHVTDILRRAIASGNVAHAYLLTGPRGVGKTSIARILAHEINSLPYTGESAHLDIIEIDAASNNSVDDIRDLRERVQIAPTSAKKKVYIIDEVHMLSKPAFNALLKTLEEPPEHIVFILATTDIEKLPSTITSRTQRFNFHSISEKDMVAHLTNIAKKEGIAIDKESLTLIARHSGGSFRDSISLLDQLQHASEGSVTTADVERALGLVADDTVKSLLDAYHTHDIASIVSALDDSQHRGVAAATLTQQLIDAIQMRVVAEPELVRLLDALLDTSRTSWPYTKLLVALASTNSSYAAKAVADQKDPLNTQAQKPAQTKPTASQKPNTTQRDSQDSRAKQQTDEARPDTVPSKVPALDFAWDDFTGRVKEKSIGASTMLGNSGYIYDGDKLTIFAGTKFKKTQLDKSLSILNASLQSIVPGAGEVVVLGAPKPPEDSQTAAVLDIMGGGEEVSL